MMLDMEVAEVIVDARKVEDLEVLVTTVGGRRVELTLSRLFDVVEAERMSLEMEVLDVMVEDRCDVDPFRYEGSYIDELASERPRCMVLPRPMVAEEDI